jgi:outer membrane protein
MQHAHSNHLFNFGLATALACATAGAHAGGAENTLKIGYAHIGFNTASGDLAGPAGTTPPGVQADLKDADTLALVYERSLSGPWSIVLQAGTPPVVKIIGAGNGAALGQVGTARAWFPAVLAHYTFDGPLGTQPYLGAGLNYTSYTEGRVDPAYTGAFGGTSSTAKLKSSWGPVLKLGIGFPLGQNWVIDAAYSRYGIRTTATITTATPGVGDIVRTIDVRSDPDVVGLTLGYRF